jgi:hypothetical protein
MPIGHGMTRWVGAGSLRRNAVIGVLSALAGGGIAAVPASALPLPPVTINGAAPSAGGPQVDVTLDGRGGDGGGGALDVLTVTFPASNDPGDEITNVSGQFNADEPFPNGIISVDEEIGDSNPGGLIKFFTQGNPCFNEGSGVVRSFSCANFFGGFGPGVQQSYVIDTSQNEGDPKPLSSIDITVKLCGQTGGDAVIAVRCTPPGPTRITRTSIDQHARTAAFAYHAGHAMHYECELIDKHRLKFRAPCGSQKKYAHGLAPGKYTFVVWGVNAGGGSAKAAGEKFTIR